MLFVHPGATISNMGAAISLLYILLYYLYCDSHRCVTCECFRSGKFMNPDSGEAMTLGRAVNQGHLAPKTQWRAYSYRTQQSQQSAGNPPSPGSIISSASHLKVHHPSTVSQYVHICTITIICIISNIHVHVVSTNTVLVIDQC